MRQLPNIITAIRLAGALILCFIEPLSVPFFIIYSLCGVSDVLDGFIARTFHVTSTTGAWLDSIADLVFYGVMIVKYFGRYLSVLPGYLMYSIYAIFAVRFITYVFVGLKFHHFAAIHTYANKLTGLAVFFGPYTLLCSCALVIFHIDVIIAAYATIEELLIHIIRKEYNSDLKTIFGLWIRKKEAIE